METNNKASLHSSGSTPLAQEHARRRARKSKKHRPSKATRYFVAILTIVFVFFIAYSIGSWIIGNIYDNSQPKETAEDTISTLQSRLDDLTARNNELADEVAELQAQLEKYNSQYGPLDAPSATNPSESADSVVQNTTEQ